MLEGMLSVLLIFLDFQKKCSITSGNSLVFKKNKTFENMLCNHKVKRPKEESREVVYEVSCKSCSFKYIGETCDRKNQHQYSLRKKNQKNGIFMHIKKNRGHKIDWNEPRYLDREPNWFRRKIKESIYINAMDPDDKLDKIMNLEKGIQINPCWREFNGWVKSSGM